MLHTKVSGIGGAWSQPLVPRTSSPNYGFILSNLDSGDDPDFTDRETALITLHPALRLTVILAPGPDAGEADASLPGGGDEPPGGPARLSVVCGCSSAPGWGTLAVVVLTGLARRRRTARPDSPPIRAAR